MARLTPHRNTLRPLVTRHPSLVTSLMSKGSKPRPVDGDKYRANYDAIFQVGRDLSPSRRALRAGGRARRAAYVDHITRAIEQNPAALIDVPKLRAYHSSLVTRHPSLSHE